MESSLAKLLLCFVLVDLISVTVAISANEKIWSFKSGLECDFEKKCEWSWGWNGGPAKSLTTDVITGEGVRELSKTSRKHYQGPEMDADGNVDGHFLWMGLNNETDCDNCVTHVSSPVFERSEARCKLEFSINMKSVNDVQNPVKVLVTHNGVTSYVPMGTVHNDTGGWKLESIILGKRNTPFNLTIEVIAGYMRPSWLAIDNIRLLNCMQYPFQGPHCNGINCPEGTCVPRSHICDVTKDCLGGEDEAMCGDMPRGSRCDFEGKDWCEWKNYQDDEMDWEIHQGETPTKGTGPTVDHTYNNNSGWYMLSTLPSKGIVADQGILESRVFDPPPCYHRNPASAYYNSCELRLYYHKRSRVGGKMSIELVKANDPAKTKVFLMTVGESGPNWTRYHAPIPDTVIWPFVIQIANVRAMRHIGDLAIDDVSLSKECFNLGGPETKVEIKKCPPPPTTPKNKFPDIPSTYRPPNGSTVLVVTTCGAKGPKGPSKEMCDEEYKNSVLPIPMIQPPQAALPGIQSWRVPDDGFYTVIAKGASGGTGVRTQDEETRGSTAVGVYKFKHGIDLYILVGQKGLSACQDNKHVPPEVKIVCNNRSEAPDHDELDRMRLIDKIHKNLAPGGGGGGGGASFVFMMESKNKALPLVIGGGGAGLAWNNIIPVGPLQNGRGSHGSLTPSSGQYMYEGHDGAGPGGGLDGKRVHDTSGESLLQGGEGGQQCQTSSSWGASGGFGGGGGACLAGGGGGGYIGGNAYKNNSIHGEGGVSFLYGKHGNIYPSNHRGDGVVYIIPAARERCGCDELCIYLDEYLKEFECYCEEPLVLDKITKRKCIHPIDVLVNATYIIIIGIGIFGVVSIPAICIYLYKRYQRNKFHNIQDSTSNQLNALRNHNGNRSMPILEDNPSYELAGSTHVKDLKAIPRENLDLVRALGQGAFGEVYQGYLKNYVGDSVEMPVAVKTLPDVRREQAEMDFQMEALIMSKFSHPNIVHFIGVCFEKLPNFIVLELLSGGDLQSFLRESRPTPERVSAIAMVDLLHCAIDVAKGCEYLEEKRFIHRDIAARNCLLTTKGPGRAVKIADFGMARDIYRNDYYRKGGRAMLPVKWMPPEAFLDGIFTSKTDIWSFGVLLWEVMSLGYMPYPGRGNQEVMQLVTHGGRLEPPTNCPGPMFRIMTQCWHPIPDERPTFTLILERLGYCAQDPDVVSAPLPIFQRPPSTERDAIVMRPKESEACLSISRRADERRIEEPTSPQSTDYLIPLPSSYSLATVRTDLNSTPSIDSNAPDCCHLDRLLEDTPPPPPTTWETSFTNSPPPSSLAPRVPTTVPPPLAINSRTPPHVSRTTLDAQATTPLLLSPPGSPPQTRPQEARERLMRTDGEQRKEIVNETIPCRSVIIET